MSNPVEASRHHPTGLRADAPAAESVSRAAPPSSAAQKQSNTIFAGRFAGRAAIVTGGASGLGLLTAERIIKEGGKVSLWDLNAAALNAAAQKLGGAHTVQLHVGRHQEVVDAAAQSREALGKIDILVNSAGITGATVAVQEFPIDSWLQVMDVNLNGTFYCCREVVPLMLPQNYGRIVNIASVAGKEGNPKASAYSASKAGVIGFTKSVAKELASRNVLVNAIAPGYIETELTKGISEEAKKYFQDNIPLGRLGQGSDIASAVLFLASDLASYITGQVLVVDGGMVM